jgi:GTP cyclohydrolase I
MTKTVAETMEEAIKAVLLEAKLSPEDRDVLEKAVRIARTLQKTIKGQAER